MFSWISVGTIAVFIPIVFILGAIVIIVAALVMKARARDIEARERLVALEKGIPLPEPAVTPHRPVHSGRRAMALVILGGGLGLTAALIASEGVREGLWGLIPLFVGAGLLVSATLDKREYETLREEERGPR